MSAFHPLQTFADALVLACEPCLIIPLGSRRLPSFRRLLRGVLFVAHGSLRVARRDLCLGGHHSSLNVRVACLIRSCRLLALAPNPEALTSASTHCRGSPNGRLQDA
jgi:hypothetical protein